ncbi:hypothetical protein OBBRIDRAFT_572892 [Obba rivulosa]|uniref:Uncharacterized protein n=1 Tax=Obba rivulosa TaxID=1052685 RepID=A0A8E2DTI9_9APHY|nr:hypothetical protein OBBRIDRAFT_572892 [Obba rivulosa]
MIRAPMILLSKTSFPACEHRARSTAKRCGTAHRTLFKMCCFLAHLLGNARGRLSSPSTQHVNESQDIHGMCSLTSGRTGGISTILSAPRRPISKRGHSVAFPCDPRPLPHLSIASSWVTDAMLLCTCELYYLVVFDRDMPHFVHHVDVALSHIRSHISYPLSPSSRPHRIARSVSKTLWAPSVSGSMQRPHTVADLVARS